MTDGEREVRYAEGASTNPTYFDLCIHHGRKKKHRHSRLPALILYIYLPLANTVMSPKIDFYSKISRRDPLHLRQGPATSIAEGNTVETFDLVSQRVKKILKVETGTC